MKVTKPLRALYCDDICPPPAYGCLSRTYWKQWVSCVKG